MNPKDSSPDHHGNSFLFGLTIGILGTMLLGTDDGRKLMQGILDSLPEHIKNLGQTGSHEHVPDYSPPLSSPEETPHHAYASEAPPPPPPDISHRPSYLYPPK